MQNLVDRFLRYVTYDTQSKPKNTHTPSSSGQMVFARHLVEELQQIGLTEASVDEYGYVMACLPSNVHYTVPAIGFIAHLDTAPDASGKHVKPQIVEHYQGGDIALGKGDEILSPIQYPELHQLHGEHLITTDGHTLLGADNKAGIAEIITAIEMLIADPSIPHGDIYIAFTPDEEIGRGADHFNRQKFAAEWAYTVDGGPVGELEFENFYAATAQVICHGVNVHPGTAKNKMVNSMYLASDFIAMMPIQETPENTDGYQGFYHLKSAKMSVALSQLDYLIRDFSRQGFADRKAFMQQQVQRLNQRLAKGHIELVITDQYANMKEQVMAHPHIIELAQSAMLECGISPIIKPIRGGTDGARLSFMGLPCPNLFTGGYNFHGIHEFITIEGMEKAVQVIVKLAEKTAQRYA
ncbi:MULTISPECIES: peptidase T [unclassified Vibrio]|uniref:peptidase T n=1 Tax=unclassified Vibrio TaxID=2614977 RepID=UPI0027CF96AC|nr:MULTISPECIES: peptidase T [unclassified Vibrio]MDQ2108444.1 peptidase T [Vibrio sp. 2017_1457_15]MDQ2161242.1 peptidase T [Vibrio sp. 2017_1457_13]